MARRAFCIEHETPKQLCSTTIKFTKMGYNKHIGDKMVQIKRRQLIYGKERDRSSKAFEFQKYWEIKRRIKWVEMEES